MIETIKKKKGITLIALIITVIIMLILAMVAISVLTSDEGLFNKLKNATKVHELAAEEEQNKVDFLNSQLEEYLAIRYVSCYMIDNGYVVVLDSEGGMYVSNSPITDLGEGYTNTGIKISKLDTIKIKTVYNGDIWGEDGRFYSFNPETRSLIEKYNGIQFKGRVSHTTTSDYALENNGDVYEIINNETNNKIDFGELKFSNFLSSHYVLTAEGDLYSIEYKDKRNSIKIKDGTFYVFLGKDNNIYDEARNGNRLNPEGIEITHFFEKNRSYVVDKNGYLYDISGYNSFVPKLYTDKTQAKETDKLVLCDTGYGIIEVVYLKCIDNKTSQDINVKEIEYEGDIILSEEGDVYLQNDYEPIVENDLAYYSCRKIESPVKIKKICYSHNFGKYFIGIDNKLYAYNYDTEIIEVVDELKMKGCFKSPIEYSNGIFAINEKNEICINAYVFTPK